MSRSLNLPVTKSFGRKIFARRFSIRPSESAQKLITPRKLQSMQTSDLRSKLRVNQATVSAISSNVASCALP